MPSCHEDIGQRTGHEQAIRVLCDATVAHLGEAEHALHYADRVLDARAYPGARTVDPTLLFAQALVAPAAFLRQVLCPLALGPGSCRSAPRKRYRPRPDPPPRAATARSPDRRARWPSLPPPSGSSWSCDRPQRGPSCRSTTGCPSWSGAYSGSRSPFAFLVELGALMIVAFHDRARGDFQPFGLKVASDFSKELLAQIVRFEQMPKLAHRGLIGRRFTAKINAHERAHRHRVVQRLLHRWVRQVEPLLQEVDAQHPLKPNRPTPRTLRLRVHRIDQRYQPRPRHHPLHLPPGTTRGAWACGRLQTHWRRTSLASLQSCFSASRLNAYALESRNLIRVSLARREAWRKSPVLEWPRPEAWSTDT